MTDIAKLEADRAGSRALRDAYRAEFGWNSGDERLKELDAAVEAADRAHYAARTAQSEWLAALSPDQWEVEKRKFLDQVEFDDYQRRQRS
jgi:hypothetical protein